MTASATGWVMCASTEAQRTWLPPDRTELILVDEADRLKMAGIEQIRDIYDRSQIGLVLIGMPGLKSGWRATHSCTHGWALYMPSGH